MPVPVNLYRVPTLEDVPVRLYTAPAPQEVAAPTPTSSPIVLPSRLPAQCFMTAAQDYVLPALILVAIVKHESRGRSLSVVNTNGTVDNGVAGINTASWGRYMQERYGITTNALLSNPCQSIRVMAYALRMEMNHRECAGVDIWCAVGRYHAPNNMANRAAYVPKVRQALMRIEQTGRFE